MDIFYNALELGLIYGIASIGIYLTLRIVDFPDLTVNGSFVLGAAVSSTMIANGTNAYIATLFSICAGYITGTITSLLNLKCGIQNLLAGIIVMIGLYSVNLRIMGGPNVVLMNYPTIFTDFNSQTLLIIFFITFCCFAFLSWILTSEIGLAFRSVGQNMIIGESYGVNHKLAIATVMASSNALVALSGSLFAQLHGFADINMGNYTIVIGLVSVIIGERLSSTRNIPIILLLCICGTIIYQFIIASALNIRDGALIKTSDTYLITSVLVVLAMISKKYSSQIK